MEQISIGEVARRVWPGYRGDPLLRGCWRAAAAAPGQRSSCLRRRRADPPRPGPDGAGGSFTVAEIRLLAEGFTDAMPASERWRTLAAAKLAEVDAVIARPRGCDACWSRRSAAAASDWRTAPPWVGMGNATRGSTRSTRIVAIAAGRPSPTATQRIPGPTAREGPIARASAYSREGRRAVLESGRGRIRVPPSRSGRG